MAPPATRSGTSRVQHDAADIQQTAPPGNQQLTRGPSPHEIPTVNTAPVDQATIARFTDSLAQMQQAMAHMQAVLMGHTTISQQRADQPEVDQAENRAPEVDQPNPGEPQLHRQEPAPEQQNRESWLEVSEPPSYRFERPPRAPIGPRRYRPDREEDLEESTAAAHDRYRVTPTPGRSTHILGRPHAFSKGSPFVPEINEARMPDKFKIPHLDHYDGSTDPYDHLQNYQTRMQLINAPDVMLCRVFPLTLKGRAHDWFYNLEPSSIYSFDELADRFNHQFVGSRRRKKTMTHLLSMYQKDREPLREYIQRYNDAVLEVDGRADPLAVADFT